MGNKIDFSSDGSFKKHPFLKSRVRSAINRTLKYENVCLPCMVSVLFTDNEGIKKINSANRNLECESETSILFIRPYSNARNRNSRNKPIMEPAVAKPAIAPFLHAL